MREAELFPLTYRGEIYRNDVEFVRGAALEILDSGSLNKKIKFSAPQWGRISRESYTLAMKRNLVRRIIGRVNFQLGHLAPPESRSPKFDLPRRGSGSPGCPRKYPVEKKALVQHLTDLVSGLRTKDGLRPASVQDWRKLHPGSLRTAQVEGVCEEVASKLNLKYKPHRPKTSARKPK